MNIVLDASAIIAFLRDEAERRWWPITSDGTTTFSCTL